MSFLSCLVFPSLFHLFLSFFLSCGGVPVPYVPGVPALSGTFLLLITFNTFTFLPACIRMLPVCCSYVLVCDSYVTRMTAEKTD